MLQIDFLLTRNPLFAYVQRTYATTQRFLEQDITSATVHGLMLLKLYALPSLYRQGNFARVGLYENDLATLMYYHTPDLPTIALELARFLSADDLAAIQAIIADIQQRIARFQRGDLTAQRRLRDMQPLRRPGDAHVLRSGGEIAQLMKFHARA